MFVLRLAAAAILVSGWLAAASILGHASETPGADAVAYTIVGGHAYPIKLSESKRDTLLVQQMGGDLAVRIAELDTWLRSLLRPPGLAWTVAVLSTLVAGAFFYCAMLSGEKAED